MRTVIIMLAISLIGAAAPRVEAAARQVVIGCKDDVEGQVLAEIMAQLLEDRGYTVDRRFSLGGTLICFEALKNGSIDVYPEYSGTLERAILQLNGAASHARMRELVRERFDLEMLDFFGFSNTYALALKKATAERLRLQHISDLKDQPDLRLDRK